MSTGLDFTTLARVKALIGESGATQDTLLGTIITAVSARIEDELRRKAKKQAYTEVYTISEGQHVLYVKAMPIDTAAAITIKASSTADFTGSTAMTANSDFAVDPNTSLIRFYTSWTAPRRGGSSVPAGPIFVQVTYTGGMAADTAAFILAFPDIAWAADLQAAYLHKRRLSPGGNVTTGGGSTSFDAQYGLLNEVKSLIQRHRRVDWY